MLNKESTPFTFGFAIALTVVCSLILGGVSQGLKTQQATNADVDVKSKVLQALDLYNSTDKKLDKKVILDYFTEAGAGDAKASIEKVAVKATGEVLELPAKALSIIKLRNEVKKDEDKRQYPLYVYYASAASKAAKKADAYILPIQGAGLWSICYGFLALEADATTIKGLIYYEHGETPGLGAEIKDNAEWVAQFTGKKILDEKGQLAAPQSTKNAAKYDHPNYFWAINGATFTLDGVNAMLTEYSGVYNNYLKTKRTTTLKEVATKLVKEIK